MVVVSCVRCGGEAARFEVGGEGGRPVLIRTGWLGTLRAYGAAADAMAPIAHGRFADVDPDLVGFWCRGCEASYCARCWDIGPPEMDDGFYDCTRGRCPAGHEQLLDD